MTAPPRIACFFLPQDPDEQDPLDPDRAADLQERLLEVASSFSPLVEDGREVERDESGQGVVRLDARGLGRLHPTPKVLLQAMVKAADAAGLHGATAALADTPFTAVVMARALAAGRGEPGEQASTSSGGSSRAPPRCWISSPGRDRQTLAPLPLQLLFAPESPGLDSDSIQQLRLLAVRTAGAFAALPANSVEKRFGPEGLCLHRLARGEAHRPLLPWHPVSVFEREADLEVPAGRLDAVERILLALLRDLFGDLVHQRKGLSRIQVSYGIERAPKIRREVEILDPMAGPDDWLRLLRLDLEGAPLNGAVAKISVRATCTTSRERRALDLFGAASEGCAAPSLAETATGGFATGAGIEASCGLALATARIRARPARIEVGVPALDDRHRPESAFHLEPSLPVTGNGRPPRARQGGRNGAFAAAREQPALGARLALRLVSPLPVSVATDENGRPSLVDGRQAVSAGPFPASGEWWASPYDRTYFEVATQDALLWVYRDGIDASWYIHGIFD